MRPSVLIGLACSLTLVAHLAGAACTPLGDADDTGCQAPDKPTLKCEDGASKAVSTLTGSLIKCNLKDSDAKFKASGDGTTFDGAGCQDTARSKYDAKAANLVSCPSCLDRGGLRDLATELVNLNGGVVFCDNSGTQCGGSACSEDSPDTGFVPPNKSIQKCEDSTAKNASKLVAAVIKCHVKTSDAQFASKRFDEESCETTAKGKFDTAAA